MGKRHVIPQRFAAFDPAKAAAKTAFCVTFVTFMALAQTSRSSMM